MPLLALSCAQMKFPARQAEQREQQQEIATHHTSASAASARAWWWRGRSTAVSDGDVVCGGAFDARTTARVRQGDDQAFVTLILRVVTDRHRERAFADIASGPGQ